MKVILDENLDEELVSSISRHEVRHVVNFGWQGTKNGELLARTGEFGFDVLITADKNMPYQQNMKGRLFFLIVLDIHPNILENQIACVPEIERLLTVGVAGEKYRVDGPHSRRRV